MLVALASCLTAGVAAVAQNREIQLRSVSATLEGDMDVSGILGIDSDVRNGFSGIKVTYNIDADATPEEIKAIVAQSQKRSAVYDIITNPTNVTVEVADAALRGESLSAHHNDGRHRCRPRRSGDEPTLTARSIDHVVLERGDVANTWKTERWDSLRLLTPNWQSRLPG